MLFDFIKQFNKQYDIYICDDIQALCDIASLYNLKCSNWTKKMQHCNSLSPFFGTKQMIYMSKNALSEIIIFTHVSCLNYVSASASHQLCLWTNCEKSNSYINASHHSYTHYWKISGSKMGD